MIPLFQALSIRRGELTKLETKMFKISKKSSPAGIK